MAHEELLHSNHSTATPVTWLLTITANCEGLGWLQSEPPHAPGEHEMAETTPWCTGTTCCSSCSHRKPQRARPERCNFGLLAGAWDAAVTSAPLDVGSSEGPRRGLGRPPSWLPAGRNKQNLPPTLRHNRVRGITPLLPGM